MKRLIAKHDISLKEELELYYAENDMKNNPQLEKAINKGISGDKLAFLLECVESERFDNDQIEVIQEALEENLTMEQIEYLANPQLYSIEMQQILWGFTVGLTMGQMEYCVKPQYDIDQMDVLMCGFKNGLSMEQVELFANPKFSDMQMTEIYWGFKNGLSIEQVKVYAKPNIDFQEMMDIRSDLEHDMSITEVKEKYDI